MGLEGLHAGPSAISWWEDLPERARRADDISAVLLAL